MGTMFHAVNGVHVATRWWGGESRGCVVALEAEARLVDMDTPLQGDDGSFETLRTLAELWAGQNRPLGGHRTRAETQPVRCEHCGEADKSQGSHGRGHCVAMHW